MPVFKRSGGRLAAITVSLVVMSLGAGSVHAAPTGAHHATSIGGYWSTSYESGTPRPAGFPADHPATNLRGETTQVNETVRSVTSNYPNAGSTDEHVASLSDGNSSTKWYASGSGQPTSSHPVYAIYSLAGATTVTAYSITSGNDAPRRDPRVWTVLGSNSASAASDADDSSWTALGSQKSQSFGARHQTNFYPIHDPGNYRYYQLRVTGNCASACSGSSGDNAKFQVADWTLRSSAGADASALGASVEDRDAAGASDGTEALRYAGRVLKPGPASSTLILQSELNVPLGTDSTLSYAIRPIDDAAAHAALDVVYTDPDGSHRRLLSSDSSLRDSAGHRIDAGSHGATVTPGSWTTVSVKLGSLAGKRVSAVLLRYDDPSAKATSFSGWVDDIKVGKAPIDTATTWRYLDAPNVDPAQGANDRTAWTRPDFDVSAGPWKDGTAAFGVHNGGTDLGSGFPVSTKLKLHKDGESGPDIEAYFFRASFTMDQATIGSIKGLVGTVVYDDTATVYLNGRRIAGWNDGHITKNVQYETSDGTDGAGSPARSTFGIRAADLRAGTNTLAVEVHQCNSTSSDSYFGLPSLTQTNGSLPFTDTQLNTTYDSDVLPDAPDGGDYFTWVLRSFTDAEQTPSIMAPNTVLPKGTTYDQLTALDDKTVVDINNAYQSTSDPQVQEALVDGHGSPYQTMADSLGSVLGPVYTDALRNGELPKTKALLSHRVEKTPTSSADWYQKAKDNYQYKRPFVRMGFNDDDGLIEPWDSAGSYDGLAGDGSFPSGHTSHAYAQGIVLATLLPRLSPQIMARVSDYANNRIVLAFHYPTDIMGGRIVGEDTAQLRWSDPDFRTLLAQAKTELHTVLARACRQVGAGDTLARCIANEKPYLPTGKALDQYTQRLTYGFPQVGPTDRDPAVPAGAQNLLRTTFPDLTAAQRRTVLAATELPSGYVMDSADDSGSWQRLNIAAAMSATVSVGDDGALTVNGVVVQANGLPV